MAYKIVKSLAHTTRHSTCRILMDYGQFYVMSDVMIFCLQTEVNVSDIATD